MWETLVLSLGQEDPLEKEMATHSSILVWKTPWMEEPDGLLSMGLQRVGHDWVTSPSPILWKDWSWSWNSSTLATWFEELTHLKRPWCWERLKVGGEGDNREWDGWMASPTQWTWVWVNSRSWWWTGRPGVLQFMGLQGVGHDWVTDLNWTEILYNNLKKKKRLGNSKYINIESCISSLLAFIAFSYCQIWSEGKPESCRYILLEFCR